MVATKIDTREIAIAFSQEKFDRAVEHARAAREVRIAAAAKAKDARRELEAAEVAEASAKSHLQTLAKAAAGYGMYE